MSKRNKLTKFDEILNAQNVYENFDPSTDLLTLSPTVEKAMKGHWAKEHFKNDNKIVLELACGRGEYTLGLARKETNTNFIGVDIKGARIWKGSKIALEERLDNVAFLRTRIEFLHQYFEKGEVSELWITFADPFIKGTKDNRRLTAPHFLEKYANILPKNGLIHIKTDSPILYYYSLETLSNDDNYRILYHEPDIYHADYLMDTLDIKTYYELDHLANNKTIRYIQASLRN